MLGLRFTGSVMFGVTRRVEVTGSNMIKLRFAVTRFIVRIRVTGRVSVKRRTFFAFFFHIIYYSTRIWKDHIHPFIKATYTLN